MDLIGWHLIGCWRRTIMSEERMRIWHADLFQFCCQMSDISFENWFWNLCCHLHRSTSWWDGFWPIDLIADWSIASGRDWWRNWAHLLWNVNWPLWLEIGLWLRLGFWMSVKTVSTSPCRWSIRVRWSFLFWFESITWFWWRFTLFAIISSWLKICRCDINEFIKKVCRVLFDEIMSNFGFDKCCYPIVDAIVVLFNLEIVSSSVVRSRIFTCLKHRVKNLARQHPKGPKKAHIFNPRIITLIA